MSKLCEITYAHCLSILRIFMSLAAPLFVDQDDVTANDLWKCKTPYVKCVLKPLFLQVNWVQNSFPLLS